LSLVFSHTRMCPLLFVAVD